MLLLHNIPCKYHQRYCIISYLSFAKGEIVIILYVRKKYRVQYKLDSLETRSTPLFSNVKAFLLHDNTKRLISEGTAIKDKKTVFDATIEQQARSFIYNNQEGTFESSPVTILLEFGAENRFIKMGETHVDLANLLNSNKNGETIAYKLEKCYDRNARLHLAVTFWDMTKNHQSLQRVIEVSHSRSQSILPYPRIRTRTQHDRNKVPTTEYSQLTDRQDKEEELSVISDKFIPTIPKNLNKTELFRKNPMKTQQSQQIVDLKTQNRIYQHQIAQFQLQYRDIQDQADTLKEMIKKYRYENEQLNNYVDQLKRESAEKEQSKEAMREQLNTEIARLLKLYQDSEHQRNKLLIQRQQEMTHQQEKYKQSEKKASDEKNRVKVLERNEQGFRRKIEEYMSQIVQYEKTIKTDQRSKLKLSQTVQVQRKEKEKVKAELQCIKIEKGKLKTSNDQLQSQLEISRFSLQQLEKEVSQLRRINKEQSQKISKYEEQIKQSNEAFMSQRSKFTRKMQEIDHKKELQQQAMEAYMQELQIKSINQHTKNGQINTLKREITRLKNELSAEHDKSEEVEHENKRLKIINSQLDQSIEDYQTKIMQLSKANAFLENQVTTMQSYQQFKEQSYDEGQVITQQQKEELIAACYEERDEIWKKELQKIENDTRTLMDKTKREKEEQLQKIKKLTEEISSCEESLKKEKAKVKESNEEEERLRKTNKEIESKCMKLEKSKAQLQTENVRHISQIKDFSQKTEIIQELQESISQLEKKIASMKKQSESLKSDLEKQRIKHKKLRTQMKEFVNTATSYLGKSQKHRIFYDQFRSDHIDAELLMIFNSAAKLFCDKHNRLRSKLELMEEMKGQLESKERQCEKINKSIRQERRGSCDSNSSINKSQSQSTTRIINAINGPNRSNTQKDESQLRNLRKELEQLRSKMKKEGNKYSELERELDRTKQNYEQNCEEVRRCKEEADMKDELLNEVKEKIRVKEKQLELAKQEISDLNVQTTQIKNQLEEVNRAYKQEKSQNMKKSTGFNKSVTSTRSQRQEISLRTQQLQKKVKSYQEEIERLKREKQERRGDNLQNRQVKNLENRIKEKEEVIAGLREALQEEREKTEQLKELQSLKVRKLKEQFQEQLQAKLRAEKELNQALIESQEKLRQLQKKIKILQENVKSANNQLTACGQREEKSKRLIINQWQLKLKTLQGQHQAHLNNLTRKIDQTKLQERSARQIEKRKDRQLSQLRLDLERSQRTIIQLTEKLDLYGIRLKNMEEQQSNYKEVIGVLENKMKADSSQERKQDRECQKDTFDNHSNFSLKPSHSDDVDYLYVCVYPLIPYKYLMLEWLFGPKKVEKPAKKEDELGQDEKWVYDYVKQYLTSPIWKNPLLDFIEENCIHFQDIEENKFQYTKIFQEFTGLTALLLESMIEEVGIPQKTLEKCIIKGIKSQKDAKIFQQILVCDNFLYFKKIMLSKNKELEVEVLKKLHKEASPADKKSQEKQIEIDAMELERLELEKAIAMSLAVEEKAQTQEEKELEEAIRQSQQEYKKEEEKRVEQVKKESKPSPLGALPPLVLGTSKANRPMNEFKEEESRLKQELETLKQVQEERKLKEKQQQENTEDRKKRLLQQRELIRKKKQEERKQELSTFISNQSTSPEKITEQQMQRRRNLMKRLKQQLKQ